MSPDHFYKVMPLIGNTRMLKAKAAVFCGHDVLMVNTLISVIRKHLDYQSSAKFSNPAPPMSASLFN